MLTSTLKDLAERLVAERIPGTRKGSDKPAYSHSIHVGQLLREAGCAEDVCTAGILHDIVEDSATTLDDLRALGFSERIVRLVDLCSHEDAVEGNDARWVCMMANLVRANDADAWTIKIADILSNIGDSATMPADRRTLLFRAKAPLMLSLTRALLEGAPLWNKLKAQVE